MPRRQTVANNRVTTAPGIPGGMARCILILLISLPALPGCSRTPSYEPQPTGFRSTADAKHGFECGAFRPCTDSPDSTLHLNTNDPVTVLAHGCHGSAGRFRSLAQLYAFHGQQAICFSYDDRDSLVTSARKLDSALDNLAGRMHSRELTVIGHSMGGLVARKAMERGHADSRISREDTRLVTVSAPMAGIGSASPCG